MQLIKLQVFIPKALRRRLRKRWIALLDIESNWLEKRLYRSFVRDGDLVFDVGANVGNKTGAFLELGSRVVAVEPNPVCAEQLRDRFSEALDEERLYVEGVAVSSEQGEIIFTIFTNSQVSSGSPEFYGSLVDDGEEAAKKVRVSTITLDDLIEKHGMPTFIKVDVEGMDALALRGLTRKPAAMSFEYHRDPRLAPCTLECFDEVRRIGFAEANFTRFADPRPLRKKWLSIEEARASFLSADFQDGDWGDVLVR